MSPDPVSAFARKRTWRPGTAAPGSPRALNLGPPCDARPWRTGPHNVYAQCMAAKGNRVGGPPPGAGAVYPYPPTDTTTTILRGSRASLEDTVGRIIRSSEFLVPALVDANSREALGFSGALRTLQAQPHGGVLIIFAGLGFIAFGGFEIIEALARRLRAPKL